MMATALNRPTRNDGPKKLQDQTSSDDRGLGTSTWSVVAAAIVGFILLVVVVVVLVVRQRQKRKLKALAKKEKHEQAEQDLAVSKLQDKLIHLEQLTPLPHSPLLEMTISNDALNGDKLAQWSTKCVSHADKSEVDKPMLRLESRFKKMEDELARKNGIRPSIHSRYVTVPIRKDTQVTLRKSNYETSMSALLDFYGNKLLVGQAPTSAEIEEHWDAVLQEQVGVLVWLGALKDSNGRERIYPYVAMVKGKTVQFGRYKIVTMAITQRNEWTTYAIDIQVAKEDWKNRRLDLVHLHTWPETRLPSNPGVEAKAVKHVTELRMSQASNGLPAMLVHCSSGVQESPAFVVTYIGRQMLVHSGYVNPMAILVHVRNHRCLALSPSVVAPKIVNVQMAMVGSVLSAVMDELDDHEGSHTVADGKPEVVVV